MSIFRSFFSYLNDLEDPPKRPPKEMIAVLDTDLYIGLLASRGYGERDRLFRKLVEEMGEYAEAIEFNNGATRKKKKFGDKDPKQMLRGEVVDIIMVGIALARAEGLKVIDILERINEKLSKREKEHQKTLGERSE